MYRLIDDEKGDDSARIEFEGTKDTLLIIYVKDQRRSTKEYLQQLSAKLDKYEIQHLFIPEDVATVDVIKLS